MVIRPDPITLDEALKRLDELIGLDEVKQQVHDWVKQIKVFKLRKAFEKLFSNTSFISLNTVDFIEQHKCWLSAFCHDNKEFGKNAFEYEALTIKQQAFELIDKLDEDLTSVDYITTLSRLYVKDKSLCVTYALLLWLNGCNKNKIVSMLKKAIKQLQHRISTISTRLK